VLFCRGLLAQTPLNDSERSYTFQWPYQGSPCHASSQALFPVLDLSVTYATLCHMLCHMLSHMLCYMLMS